jgi:hypothetical protein
MSKMRANRHVCAKTENVNTMQDHSTSHLFSITLILGRVVVEVLAFCRLVDDTCSDGPVTKVLTILAFFCVSRDEVFHDFKDLFLHYRGSVEFIESLSVIATTKIHIARWQVSNSFQLEE